MRNGAWLARQHLVAEIPLKLSRFWARTLSVTTDRNKGSRVTVRITGRKSLIHLTSDMYRKLCCIRVQHGNQGEFTIKRCPAHPVMSADIVQVQQFRHLLR